MTRNAPNPWLLAAALLGALGVGLGAFGSHALRDSLTAAALHTWETAVAYQFWHALVLLALGLWREQLHTAALRQAVNRAALVLLLGVLCFSGSLYPLVAFGWRPLVFVTPLGGFLLIGGWVLLGHAAWLASRLQREP
ncbi:MAG: DUF423 domain-containing protein [Halothiobacillaceae bacterium]|nr:DUF423 domain-containing protein [Halothiobacillaceae bacterium]MDY0050578.1 DUF423 domain-containing protein [Halothiobacillaceae bacterium]